MLDIVTLIAGSTKEMFEEPLRGIEEIPSDQVGITGRQVCYFIKRRGFASHAENCLGNEQEKQDQDRT